MAYGDLVPLLLGPALRHVGDTTALVWVQTESASTVEVLGCSASTFEVQGHHFALVPVTNLTPDTVTEYQVMVDGEHGLAARGLAVPAERDPYPRTGVAHRLRAIFGSCRYPKTEVQKIESKLGLDALDSVRHPDGRTRNRRVAGRADPAR